MDPGNVVFPQEDEQAVPQVSTTSKRRPALLKLARFLGAPFRSFSALGQKIGANTVKPALIELQYYATLIGVLAIAIGYQAWSAHHTTIKDIVVGVLIGVLIVVLLLKLSQLMHGFARRGTAMTKATAVGVFLLIALVIGGLWKQFPQFVFGVMADIVVLMLMADLFAKVSEDERRDAYREELYEELAAPLVAAQQIVTVVNGTLQQVNNLIPEVNQTIASVTVLEQQAQETALTIKSTQAAQQQDVDDKVEARKAQYITDWNNDAKRNLADHIQGREEDAARKAVHQNDGEISALQREIAALQGQIAALTGQSNASQQQPHVTTNPAGQTVINQDGTPVSARWGG
jgi:hypothetical protein